MSPRQTKYLSYFSFSLRNHSFSDRKCPTITAHTRRDQGCPSFPPSRGMYRHGLATGWVPIPVSTTCPPPSPGRFPYPPFPVSRIKTHVDPVAVPSFAPSLLLLIPSFSLLRLLSTGTFLHSLPLHILFYFTTLPWSYQIAKLFATLSFSQSYGDIHIYIYKHTYTQSYIYIQTFQAFCWPTSSKSTTTLAFTNIRNISSLSN